MNTGSFRSDIQVNSVPNTRRDRPSSSSPTTSPFSISSSVKGFAALLAVVLPAVAVFWAGLQKLGAFCAVGLGVLHGIFSPLAWVVVLTDLLSGVLALLYWRRIRQPGGER